jgi:serine protease Do
MSDTVSAEEMIRTTKSSVLYLQDAECAGTGFCISTKGHILTCSHVVAGDLIQAQSALGETAEARILARDLVHDLAILECVALSGIPLTFSDPTGIAEGQTVFALGHPLGLGFTVSRGIVSSVNRIVRGVAFLQTDVPLNPGNSGGPIVNENGEVVGVADWGFAEGHGLGFAVAVRHVFAFAAQVRVPLNRAQSYSVASSD